MAVLRHEREYAFWTYGPMIDSQFYTCHAIKAGNIGDECNGNAHQGFELPDGTFLGPECEPPTS